MGGDPAELMRICVENGMFTLSFMKEGLQKVHIPHGSLRDNRLTEYDLVPRVAG